MISLKMPKTLLHFFSPVSKKNGNVSSPKSNSSTPLKPKNTFLTPKSTGKIPINKSALFSPEKMINFEVYDLVWAKLDGYPWWPAIVCNHGITGAHVKTENNKKFIHVQFFDDPITHAWVEGKNLDNYKGPKAPDFEKGSKFFSTDPNVVKAVKKADEAILKEKEERGKILVKFEDDLEEFAGMFDEEMSDEESVISSSSKVDAGGRKKRKAARKAAKKRRRIMQSDSDDNFESEDEFNPVKAGEEESDSDEYEDDKTVSSEPSSESEPEESPVKDSRKRKRKDSRKTQSKGSAPAVLMTPNNPKLLKTTPETPSNSQSRTPLVCNQTKSRLSLFQATDLDGSFATETSSKYLHETLEFLFPENIRDNQDRKRGSPDYDPSTLKVPANFLKTQTPAMYQWWKMKSEHYDVILFFKVGKFYELYHMDAVVGVNELGLIYMKGGFAHSGFPEIAFGRYSESLVQKGYKVARVEQTETPEQNAKRTKHKALTKQEKTLRREICRIVTKGTQNLASWHGWCNINSGNNFLLAVIERPLNATTVQDGLSNACREFGVCFVDTSVGQFQLGQFVDDRHCSTLCTMLSHFTPCQVLYERGMLSGALKKILNSGLSTVMQEALIPGSQFWDSNKTIKMIVSEGYFVQDGEEKWPPALQSMMSDEDAVSLTASKNHSLAISSLGACIFYFKKCLIDYEVLSLKQFKEYVPPRIENSQANAENLENVIDLFAGDEKMILDSVTLANLQILENDTGGKEGTLIERLDKCQTPFGKRLIRQWICSPPCNPETSSDRLDALEDLMDHPEIISESLEVLKKMPDLERMLMKIHVLSKGAKKSDHPDNRAILYEDDKYSKKKIEDFLAILENYELAHNLLQKFQPQLINFKSTLLTKLLGFENASIDVGNFPNLSETLSRWKSAFNHKKARETGKIIPNQGANPEFDEASDEISTIEAELAAYLKDQKKILSCSSLCYKGNGSNRFQLEMPIDVANSRNLSGYIISGQRKGYKSFRTEETMAFLKEMESAEARMDAAQSETMAIIFREFDQDYAMWNKAIQCLAMLDVLLSLAQYCKSSEHEMCRPTLVRQKTQNPFLQISTARHPCVTHTFMGDDFIPNDTVLGDEEDKESPRCLVLTGPNMGGKSTLMRQVGLIVVLAQLGCYVPAEQCRLSPIDRVFTRLGASDRIMAGESTFYVELSETSSILKHATKHSLVLLDELGRGTATYDGTAIALAVVKEVSSNIRCRTIFSTHYHNVVDDLEGSSDVKQGHMACMVENEDVDDKDPSKEAITFLYKLTEGPCPKSYGFHAAKLADIPESVIALARRKAAELENNNKFLASFRSLFDNEWRGDPTDLVPGGL